MDRTKTTPLKRVQFLQQTNANEDVPSVDNPTKGHTRAMSGDRVSIESIGEQGDNGRGYRRQ